MRHQRRLQLLRRPLAHGKHRRQAPAPHGPLPDLPSSNRRDSGLTEYVTVISLLLLLVRQMLWVLLPLRGARASLR
jgi:hypothetical protein